MAQPIVRTRVDRDRLVAHVEGRSQDHQFYETVRRQFNSAVLGRGLNAGVARLLAGEGDAVVAGVAERRGRCHEYSDHEESNEFAHDCSNGWFEYRVELRRSARSAD